MGLLARDLNRLDELQREIIALGGQALVLPVDVADASAIEAAAERVEQTLGPIDVWVNNAMVTVFSPIMEMQAEEYQRVTEVTYLGTVYGTLAALRRMRSRQRGSIVLVGSALAYRGIPLQSAYCAAKHAIAGFNDSLQCELLHEHSSIRVTMVQLAAFNTPQFDWAKSRMPRKLRPIGKVFQPELAARAIVWAAQHGKRELIVGWPAWYAIWGNKFFPSLGDRYLADTAIDGQQENEVRQVHSDNLWQPVTGAFGAHGRFDAIAKYNSLQFFFATHPIFNLVLTCIGFLLIVLAWRYV